MVKLQDKVNKDYFIDLYINQRKTMKEVAEILNIKYSAVNTLKNLWGITRKDDPIRKILSKDLLYDLYVNKNMGKWEFCWKIRSRFPIRQDSGQSRKYRSECLLL